MQADEMGPEPGSNVEMVEESSVKPVKSESEETSATSDTLPTTASSPPAAGAAAGAATTTTAAAATAPAAAATTSTLLTGWRLHATTVGLLLSLFFANLEVTIISTSLLSITSDLQSFNQSSWIVTAYLLTFTGFMIVVTKLSDILGRKAMLLACHLIFVVFSAVCGGSKSMIELIVARAFQGIGGAGLYGLSIVICFDIAPPAKWPAYTAMCSMALAFGLLFGPLIGGGIINNSTWRWVFLLNVPAGVAIFALLLVALPANIPYREHNSRERGMAFTYGKETLQRVDFAGALLLLGAGLLLITALQLPGNGYTWSSATVIVLLVIAALLAILFFTWEYWITRSSTLQEPVFPWRFLSSRVWIMMLVVSLFTGMAYTVAMIELPLRFQTVNQLSALDAGIRLLPFAFSAPFGSAISATVVSKAKIPPIYLVFLGAALQTAGIAPLSTLPSSPDVIPAQYGYQVLAGFGTGINLGLLVLMTPHVVEPRDRAVGTGTITQMRAMGGTVGLAIVSSVMNGYLGSRLPSLLTPAQLASIQSDPQVIATFPQSLQDSVRAVYADGYNLQFRIIIGFAAAQLLGVALMWRNPPLRVA